LGGSKLQQPQRFSVVLSNAFAIAVLFLLPSCPSSETDCFDYNATKWRVALVKFLHAWGSDAAAAVGDVYEVESKWHQRKAGGMHQIHIDSTRPALPFVHQFSSFWPWSSSERPLGERIVQAAASFNYHHCHRPP
jgi:hypothetical protein